MKVEGVNDILKRRRKKKKVDCESRSLGVQPRWKNWKD